MTKRKAQINLPILLLSTALTIAACGGGGGGGGSSDATGGSSGSESSQNFGTANNAQIRPGVTINSAQGSCTSNFLYAPNNSTAYIGVAAHCFSLDDDSVDPCNSRTENIGFNNVVIENANRPGTLIYNSWAAMQQNSETPGSAVCVGNDFALVEIHPDDLDNIHPSARVFGGPTALFTGFGSVGDTVYNYGQSSLQGGVQNLEEREGEITNIRNNGWTYIIQTDNPGLPGDSGSAVLHESGRAIAVLVTLGVSTGLGQTVNNGAANLEKALSYAKGGGFVAASTALLTSNDFTR